MEEGVFGGKRSLPQYILPQANQHTVAKLPGNMVTPAKSAETWQALMELRCRREIIERWLAGGSLSDNVRQSLQTMLADVDDQVRLLTNGRG